MMRSPRALIAAIIVFSALSFACVGVQDTSRTQPKAEQPKAEQPAAPKSNDGGFTVNETTVPTTPQAPAGDGFTVNETAVPNK